MYLKRRNLYNAGQSAQLFINMNDAVHVMYIGDTPIVPGFYI